MYEPKIIGFLCTWCSYTGADTAGISRLKYPANLRAVRVPCSGRVSPELVLRAFEQGADGVLVLGCHIGECHYESGNHRTAKRMPVLGALLAFAGLEPERLRLDWVSASEGERFARIVTEFTEAVRSLGPARWLASGPPPYPPTRIQSAEKSAYSPDAASAKAITRAIQDQARDLLASGQVSCVIGYEVGPRGRVRPAFVRDPEQVERLVWNQACSHNLARYLPEKLKPKRPGAGDPAQSEKVAVVVKPCDSRALNVQLAEHLYSRDQVHAIGVLCPGVVEPARNPTNGGQAGLENPDPLVLQDRCLACGERTPAVYDTLVQDPARAPAGPITLAGPPDARIEQLQALSPAERFEFWLSQFDRCIRCYACRQACPICNCPTCLYERDDSLWVGMGIRMNEKRAFHLGRAYHLAGRCVGCDECERACPVNIPIGLINRMLAMEMESAFGFRAGCAAVPPPFVTVLAGEEG